MSGVLRSLGKIFISPISAIVGGKAGKIIRKVAIGALAVGAVVLTGGAALGVLPSLGTVVGGLGLSAGLTSALTGAISTGAVGALTGLATGGFKGMEKGLLMGGLTGGVMGGLGILGPNGLIGGGKAAAGAASGAASGGATSAGGGLLQNSALAHAISNPIPSVFEGGAGFAPLAGSPLAAAGTAGAAGAAAGIAPSIASGVTSSVLAAPAAAATAATHGGLLGFLNSNPLLASQLFGSVASAFTPSDTVAALKAKLSTDQKAAAAAFGGAYSRPNPFGVQSYGPPPAVQPNNYFQPRSSRWVWDPNQNTVVEQKV